MTAAKVKAQLTEAGWKLHEIRRTRLMSRGINVSLHLYIHPSLNGVFTQTQALKLTKEMKSYAKN